MKNFKQFIVDEAMSEERWGIVTPQFRKKCQKEFKKILNVKGTKITTGQKLRYYYDKNRNIQFCVIEVLYTSDDLNRAYLGTVYGDKSLSKEENAEFVKKCHTDIKRFINERIDFVKRMYGVAKELFRRGTTSGVREQLDVRLAPVQVGDNLWMNYRAWNTIGRKERRYYWVDSGLDIQEKWIFCDTPQPMYYEK